MTSHPIAPGVITPCSGDPELFFSEHPGHIVKAKKICRSCPLLAPCLKFSLAHLDHGVWAATTEDERQEIRRRQRITPVRPQVIVRMDANGIRQAVAS